MNVLIINQHTNNFGDDSAGLALIYNLLKFKNINQIDLVYNTLGKIPFDDSKLNHNLEIRMKNIGIISFLTYFLFRKFGKKNYRNPYLMKLLELIRKSDVIYVSPAGANIGIYSDWRFLVKLLVVVMEGKQPVFHLNTIGKSSSFIFNFFAKRVLRKSKIYVREKKSKLYIETIGCQATLGVDTSFSCQLVSHEKVRENVIGFVPTDLSWHPNFKNIDLEVLLKQQFYPELVQFLKDNNYILEIIPHLCNDEEFNYFVKVKNCLVNLGLAKEKIIIRTDVKTIYDYEKVLSSNYINIGMRYHTIVISAKYNRPFLALAYENKMVEVSEYTNMSEFCSMLYQKELVKDYYYLLNKLKNDNIQMANQLQLRYKEYIYKKSILPLEIIKNK